MKNIARLCLLLSLSLGTLLISACATTNTADSNAAPVGPDGQPVSTTPWNKPASWEGGGALGGMMGH